MALSSRRRLCDQELMDVFEDSGSDVESVAEESTDSDVPGDLSSETDATSYTDIEEPVVVRTWCELESLDQAPPPRFPFTGVPGQKRNCDHNPLAYLELFLTEDIIQRIVEETNCYAAQQQGAPLSRLSRTRRWEPVTRDDIWLFLGLIFLQGLVGKPLQKWYWSTNRMIATPFFSCVMPEYRFSLIMKFLHFANNQDFDEATHPAPKLKKIWDIYQMMVGNFRDAYTPDRDVTVDESLMAYKGRLSWVHFIASKRARFGIKSLMLCEAKSGYIWNSIVYTGKGTTFGPQFSEYGLATSSVLTLIEPLLDQGYCLTTDNFYTSPELCDYLIQHKTDCYGTIRPNWRQLPPAFSARRLKKGEIIAWQKGKMMALWWKDKRDVCILSTVHNAATVHTTTRGNKEVDKPQAIVDYNNHTMGGVDRADAAMTFYSAVRKQQKKILQKNFQAPPGTVHVECLCAVQTEQ
ncbi:piggyBac transposable element-derived protein 4-like [Hyperolius riggenbachi]|uniref:piggyBac transposable element-derived protein 4-like n=1 Tax=Hyperolius riggenbachi TaxID=752182 RepID=UPI0035A30C44